MKLSRLQHALLQELEEAGAENITVLANTVRPASKAEFVSAVEDLVRRRRAEWGDGEVRNGRYVYFAVEAPDWAELRYGGGRYTWSGAPPLLMLCGGFED